MCYLNVVANIPTLIENKVSHISRLKSRIPKENKISAQFNIDGIPLFKSNNVQLWPIMCSLNWDVLWNRKTQPWEWKRCRFFKEFHKLTVNGIKFEDKVYNVSIDGFVCDAPAKAFLICIKTHTGHSACESCTPHGSCDGRVVYKNSKDIYPLRKAQQFHNT